MVKAIVGANWGDEGKGKITDVMAAQSDVVIRFQGGSNAGQDVYKRQGQTLELLPDKEMTCLIIPCFLKNI